MAEGKARVQRTRVPVRRLSAQDLGIEVSADINADHASNRPDDPVLERDDPRLLEVRELLQDFGGVIFTGPPGTSKSWYAARIATTLAEGDDAVRFVQFHPSYQYEDFVQGFVPKQGGEGFELVGKHLLEMCAMADEDPDRTVVLVIDELSRGDPGRIFGEALTYIEKSKRTLPCRLASGDEIAIPENLVILATMNPLDRGVDEVDAAFERRFAKIAMDPDVEILGQKLKENGVPESLQIRIVDFFRAANREAQSNPYTAVGHTFFLEVRNEEDVRRLWDHQLRFLFERAYQLDPEGFEQISRRYQKIIEGPGSQSAQ